MPIFPLPQFEADLKADQEAYEALKPPKTIVVRFGVVKMIGEFPYDGDAKPGCGSKLVARTHRGTELCEMLTSTCPNAGCSKSVSRKEMLEYIDNSGGRDYPYFVEGRILRIATVEDMNKQSALEAGKHEHVVRARQAVERLGLHMKIVDAEEMIGGERITFYFASTKEEHVRVDFRPLVMELAKQYHTRIEMRQVGARDEARITADYEKCGQHCCCKSFLKVLKPVSMKNAKIQKATLDPLKISGRCGRLMCCLRYEESTYDDLRKRLPKKKVPVMTPDGPGIVIDTQILTQLVLVRIDATNEDGAYPVENIELITGKPGLAPGAAPAGKAAATEDTDDAEALDLDQPAAQRSGPLPPAPLLPRTDRADRADRGPGGGGGGGGGGPRRDAKDPRDLNDPRDRQARDGRDQPPRGDRPPSDRPPSDRPPGDRPSGPRRDGDRPRNDRGPNDRGSGDRGPSEQGGQGSQGGQGPSNRGPRPQGPGASQGPDRRDNRGPNPNPQGDRSRGDRPQGDRQQGGRPQGDQRSGGGGGFPPAQQQGQRPPAPRGPGGPPSGRSPNAWPQNMGGPPSPQQGQQRPSQQPPQTPPQTPPPPPSAPESRGDTPSA